MALQVDRVKETTSVAGTGNATLLGAQANFISFATAYPGTSTPNVPYEIQDTPNAAWETGIGTYTLSGTVLSRDYVLSSSNANAKVNFAAGTKDIFITYPAMNCNFPMVKRQIDAGTNIIIPAGYELNLSSLMINLGTIYMFGDIFIL